MKAKEARKLLQIIGQPNSRALQKLLQNDLLPGCDRTTMDVKAADHLHGPVSSKLRQCIMMFPLSNP